MSILIWNVRGLNKKVRRQDLKEHVQKWTPIVLVLVETKIRPHKDYKILKCLPGIWDYTNNYDFSHLGRVWICCDARIWKCQVFSKSMQQSLLQQQIKEGL